MITIPREPEVGQVWTGDGIEMKITQVTETTIRLESRPSESGLYRYTIIPRSLWPSTFRFVGTL